MQNAVCVHAHTHTHTHTHTHMVDSVVIKTHVRSATARLSATKSLGERALREQVCPGEVIFLPESNNQNYLTILFPELVLSNCVQIALPDSERKHLTPYAGGGVAAAVRTRQGEP